MQRLLHILATRRAAIAVMAATILTLAGFAIWAARTTYQSVNDVQRQTALDGAFQDARHAIAQENLAARRYQLSPDREHIYEFRTARTELDESLATVRAQGSPGDISVAQTIQQQNDQAAGWFAKLPGYILSNDVMHVVGITDGRLQPMFDSMAATLDITGRAHRKAALASLSQSRWSEKVVVATTGITVALGMLLLASATAVMRYRERLERIRLREVDRLTRAALTDSLTGLGNHRAFEEDLQADMAEAAVTGKALSLALLDLDGLKQTNDAHGHQVGDECIRAMGATLAEAGHGARAYRIGGDEFAVIVPDRRAIDTLYLVQHLQATMSVNAGAWPVGDRQRLASNNWVPPMTQTSSAPLASAMARPAAMSASRRVKFQPPSARKFGSRDKTRLGRPGSGFLGRLSQVLRPISTGLPMVTALKPLQVRCEPPRQGAVAADDAVLRNRNNQGEFGSATAPSLADGHPRVARLTESRCRNTLSQRSPVSPPPFAVNFLISMAAAAAGEKGDNTGLYLGVAMARSQHRPSTISPAIAAPQTPQPSARQRALAFSPPIRAKPRSIWCAPASSAK